MSRHSFAAALFALASLAPLMTLVAKEHPAHKFNAEEWFARRDNATEEAARLKEEFFECQSRVSSPAENVTVPVESYPDGSVKACILAKRAQFFLDTGKVWGEDVTIRHFSKDGLIEAEVRAQHCVVDRKERCGWAEGYAIVVYKGTTVEGRGVYFSLSEEYIAILEGSKIVSSDLKFGGLKL